MYIFQKEERRRGEGTRPDVGCKRPMYDRRYFALFGTSEASAEMLYHLGTALKIHTDKMKENRGL